MSINLEISIDNRCLRHFNSWGILRERYAKGKISKDQNDKMREDLWK